MQIIKYDLVSEADLLSRLKRTRLRGFDRAEVYRDATLEILEADPAALTPAQRYVLQEGVQAILDVADAFESRWGSMYSRYAGLYCSGPRGATLMVTCRSRSCRP
jgi:hypothetical protein